MASSSTTFSRYVLLSRLAVSWYLDGHMQATVVLANGAALTVSESENTDLFWAIRGGGSNFGVCTEFVLRLHPQRRTIFAGNVIFPAAVLDDLMGVLSEWWKTVKDHEGMLQVLGRDPECLGRIALFFPYFIMDQRKKGARTSRNFMILSPSSTGLAKYLLNR